MSNHNYNSSNNNSFPVPSKHPLADSSPPFFDTSSPSSSPISSSAESVSPSSPSHPHPPPPPPPAIISIGHINFVAQGQLEPAKFCVVDKDHSVRPFATKKFLEKFQLSNPEVLISITGSAFDFPLRSSKLEQIFSRGLLRAAQNTKAWIVTGGSDCGVMKRVGEALRGQDQRALVPCIGIASYNKITSNQLLDPTSTEPVRYVPDKPNDVTSAALNPDHTHFILVSSKDGEWGQEIRFRTKFEDYISRKMKIPMVLVAINGGPGTVETVFEGITRKFPIIIVEGSGRASDAMAAYVKHCREPQRYKSDEWDQFKAQAWRTMTPEFEQKFERYLRKMRKNEKYITIFNPNENETEDMDKAILRSIFASHESSDFEHKLKLGVNWGRADLLEELFQKYDSTVAVDVKVQALSSALHESLKLDKPDIYELLVSKGASLDGVKISELYQLARTQIKRLAAFAGLKSRGTVDADDNSQKGGQIRRESMQSDRGSNFSLNDDYSPGSPFAINDSTASMRTDLRISLQDLRDSTISILTQNHGLRTSGYSQISEDLEANEGTTRDKMKSSGIFSRGPTPRDSGIFSRGPTPRDDLRSSGSFRRLGEEDSRVGSFRKAMQALEERGAKFNKEKVPMHTSERYALLDDTLDSLELSPVLSSDQSPRPQKNHLEKPGKILAAINPMYANLLVDEVTNIDILVWTIMADRFDLAKAVWRRTEFTIHSALVACHLYKVLGEWFRDEVYNEQYAWFEAVAISVLTEMKYEEAEKVLDWKWEELDNNDALSLAEYAECKDFFSAPHVQQNLDAKFYSKPEKNVQVVPGTKIWNILVMMLLPFTICNSGDFCAIRGKNIPKRRYFYSLPVVKLLSSSVSYIFFLLVLLVNLISIEPDSHNAARFDIRWYESLLWIWLFSSLIEEAHQFSKDPKKHFSQISNKMDAVMYALLSIYFVLRLLAWLFQSQALLLGYTDVLVFATIACFLRFMNVFAVSKSLGPLFFVIIRLLKDVGQWLFIFVLFMISFQAGIFAFTRQVGESGWKLFPNGSMGAGFTAILGDLGNDTMEWMTHTRFGVAVVLLYSLVTQVMLVNLLIAMMGNTYTVVKDNSDKEWKFYRYTLIADYNASSTCPPPFNIIYMIYRKVKRFRNRYALPKPPSTSNEKAVNKIMKDATERVIEQEEAKVKYALPAVSGSIHEHMRLLNTQRDNDRLYLEQKMELSANKIGSLEGKFDVKFRALEERFLGLEKRMEDSEKAQVARMEKLETLEKHMQAILSILQAPNRN
eukprot:Phypoly_transcript_00720.p1 GENE.Phypoly_transcript_00720~~Phypoly_transcript_00720.p1  ORF type:complete len:1269 (+),score=165.16 Phypoly_transcript_00720:288-4094(+)